MYVFGDFNRGFSMGSDVPTYLFMIVAALMYLASGVLYLASYRGCFPRPTPGALWAEYLNCLPCLAMVCTSALYYWNDGKHERVFNGIMLVEAGAMLLWLLALCYLKAWHELLPPEKARAPLSPLSLLDVGFQAELLNIVPSAFYVASSIVGVYFRFYAPPAEAAVALSSIPYALRVSSKINIFADIMFAADALLYFVISYQDFKEDTAAAVAIARGLSSMSEGVAVDPRHLGHIFYAARSLAARSREQKLADSPPSLTSLLRLRRQRNEGSTGHPSGEWLDTTTDDLQTPLLSEQPTVPGQTRPQASRLVCGGSVPAQAVNAVGDRGGAHSPSLFVSPFAASLPYWEVGPGEHTNAEPTRRSSAELSMMAEITSNPPISLAFNEKIASTSSEACLTADSSEPHGRPYNRHNHNRDNTKAALSTTFHTIIRPMDDNHAGPGEMVQWYHEDAGNHPHYHKLEPKECHHHGARQCRHCSEMHGLKSSHPLHSAALRHPAAQKCRDEKSARASHGQPHAHGQDHNLGHVHLSSHHAPSQAAHRSHGRIQAKIAHRHAQRRDTHDVLLDGGLQHLLSQFAPLSSVAAGLSLTGNDRDERSHPIHMASSVTVQDFAAHSFQVGSGPSDGGLPEARTRPFMVADAPRQLPQRNAQNRQSFILDECQQSAIDPSISHTAVGARSIAGNPMLTLSSLQDALERRLLACRQRHGDYITRLTDEAGGEYDNNATMRSEEVGDARRLHGLDTEYRRGCLLLTVCALFEISEWIIPAIDTIGYRIIC
jgi:hypothetical protein